MYKYEEKAKKNTAKIPYVSKQRFKPDQVIHPKQGVFPSTGEVVGNPLRDCTKPQKEVDRIAAGYGSSVVQRLVGFEFQSLGNSGEDVLLGTPGEAKVPCGHAFPILGRTGYNITGDMGDYEYIIDAVDERDDAQIALLMKRCKQAAKTHNNIKKSLTLKNAERDEIGGQQYWRYPTSPALPACYLRQSANTSAHPHMTAGIELNRLDTFFNNYADVLGSTIVKPYSTEQPKSVSKLNLKHGGSAAGLADREKAIMDSVSEHSRTPSAQKAPGNIRAVTTPGGKGLIRILASMVQAFDSYYKSKGMPANAKSAVPLMPRTSMYDAFLLLAAPDQAAIRNIWTAGVGTDPMLKFIVGKSVMRKQGGGGIIKADSEGTDPFDAVLAADGNGVVSIGDWLRKLPADADNPLGVFLGIDAIRQAAPGTWYAGMTRSTDVGHDTTTHHVVGMLLEIRNLQRQVETNDWPKLARDAALLVRIANTGSIQQK